MEREMSNEAREKANEYHRNYKREMSDEAKRAAAEYQRNYRRKNPDKLRQYNITYWERKAHEGQTIEHRVTNLHKQGKSLREIGQELGLSHMTVTRMLQRVTDNE